MKKRILHPLTPLSTFPQKRKGSISTKTETRQAIPLETQESQKWNPTSCKPPLQAQLYKHSDLTSNLAQPPAYHS